MNPDPAAGCWICDYRPCPFDCADLLPPAPPKQADLFAPAETEQKTTNASKLQ